MNLQLYYNFKPIKGFVYILYSIDFFVTSNKKAHLNANHVPKKTPKRKRIGRPKMVQWQSERICTKKPYIDVQG